jgi:L-aminopeptidase/D-esterase-like protein
LLAAEQATGVESAAAAALGDYCGDFSDGAVGAGTVKTAYQVGSGYGDADVSSRAPPRCNVNSNVTCVEVAASK